MASRVELTVGYQRQFAVGAARTEQDLNHAGSRPGRWAPLSRGPWTLRCLGAGTTCCSLGLLLVAVLSPRWLLIDSEDDGYHSGVWWLCSRPVCAGIVTETAYFKAIRALLLFALLASSVAVASLLVSIRPFARWRGSRFLVSATANFIAGLLVLISVVIFTAHVMLHSVNPQARAFFEWAFFLGWTLCPLFVLSGILSLFVYSSLPALSPRVGPRDLPSQDLEEMPGPGGLEKGPGAEPPPLRRVTLVRWELEGGPGAEPLPAPPGQVTPAQGELEGGLEGGPGTEPLPLGQVTPAQGELERGAVSSCSTCLSFLLLSAALLGPGWRDGGHPQDAGVLAGLCTKLVCGSTRQASDLLRAARICLTLATLTGFLAAVAVLSRCSRLARVGKVPSLLISTAASFTAGLSGLTAMVLYTLAEARHAATLNITWSFCLAWLAFTLSIVNGVFSLLTHVLYPEPGPQRWPCLGPDGCLHTRTQEQLAGE
ncbi:uncharacterized protein LOC135976879 [Chrysemys picta bellii]|uniref:uncharacterized protein LOC135976879 n=1 Tax=Chrysemys picta bellii TaxID=8478 RepID=UPI0032B1DD6F